MDLNLSPRAVAIIESRMATGDFDRPSDVVNMALALLDRLAPGEGADDTPWLREAYAEGLASGDGGPFDADALFAEITGRPRGGG